MASGDKLANWQIAERVGTGIMASDAAAGAYTAETSILTVTVAMTSGRKYAVRAYARASSDAASTSAMYRVREDTVTGNQNSINRVLLDADSAGAGCELYGEYTAAATAAKTFVLSVIRRTGTGNLTPRNPSYLVVDSLPT